MRRISSFVSKLPQRFYSSSKSSQIISLREKYLSPSLGTFTAYDEPLVLKKGSMQYMWDVDENKYIDLLGQNLCISVGHAHPVVTRAAIKQMEELPHCTTMYYHEQPANLAKELVERVPPHPSGEDYVVHLVCTGSEAVDLATQMARVYTGNSQMLGLYRAYHGLQGAAATLTSIGKKAEQSAYHTMYPGVSRVRANNLEELKEYFEYGTNGNIAGFIAEPLQGFGGIYPLDHGYLKEAFDLTRKHGGVAISDEVQTGFGRTGEAYWGFDTPNNKAVPDIITTAKGLGNGVGIIAAVIARRSIAEAFSGRMWFNTYGSNPIASAAARKVLHVIDNENLLQNCKTQGELFKSRLTKSCEKYPQVLKEIRGSGLFQGLQITGKTLEDSTKHALEIHRRLLPMGVVLGRGSAAGNVFRIQPPMCIMEEDVEYVCNSIDFVVSEYIAENQL